MPSLGFGLGPGVTRNAPRLLDPFSLPGVVAGFSVRDTELYQDAAGATLVASAGDPVRLALDLANGLRRGPELLINGDFSDGETGWTIVEPAAVSGGVLVAYSGGGAQQWQDVAVTPGEWYEVRYRVRKTTACDCNIKIENINGGSGNLYFRNAFPISASFADYRVLGRATGSGLRISAGNWTQDGGFEVDSLSVRAVPGYHLSAPSDAVRPVYQTDGTYHWLESDGVDDVLQINSRLGFDTNPELWFMAAVRPISYSGSPDRVFHLGAGGASGTIAGGLGTNSSWRHNNGNRTFPQVPLGSDVVVTWSRQAGDTYGDQLFYVDGGAQVETSVLNPTNTPFDTAENFSILGGSGDPLNARLYAWIMMNRTPSAAEETAIRRHFARLYEGAA